MVHKLILKRKLTSRGLRLTPVTEVTVVSFGISPPFGRLFPSRGEITYVLLTRLPLY